MVCDVFGALFKILMVFFWFGSASVDLVGVMVSFVKFSELVSSAREKRGGDDRICIES